MQRGGLFFCFRAAITGLPRVIVAPAIRAGPVECHSYQLLSFCGLRCFSFLYSASHAWNSSSAPGWSIACLTDASTHWASSRLRNAGIAETSTQTSLSRAISGEARGLAILIHPSSMPKISTSAHTRKSSASGLLANSVKPRSPRRLIHTASVFFSPISNLRFSEASTFLLS